MSDAPINQKEMVEMFGEEIPIEAASLLFASPDDMTIGEVRRQLRDIAKRNKQIPILALITAEAVEALDKELIIECERAMKQRNGWLDTNVSTASHGGSHDTCFGALVRRWLQKLSIPADNPDYVQLNYEHAAHSVARYAWRTYPPNANVKLTDEERLSMIKYHPVIKKLGEPHVIKD